MSRDRYDEKMDKLVKRMSRAVDGEPYYDVGSVCACMVAYSVIEGFQPQSRAEALDKFIAFMKQLVAEAHPAIAPPPLGSGGDRGRMAAPTARRANTCWGSCSPC